MVGYKKRPRGRNIKTALTNCEIAVEGEPGWILVEIKGETRMV